MLCMEYTINKKVEMVRVDMNTEVRHFLRMRKRVGNEKGQRVNQSGLEDYKAYLKKVCMNDLFGTRHDIRKQEDELS